MPVQSTELSMLRLSLFVNTGTYQWVSKQMPAFVVSHMSYVAPVTGVQNFYSTKGHIPDSQRSEGKVTYSLMEWKSLAESRGRVVGSLLWGQRH